MQDFATGSTVLCPTLADTETAAAWLIDRLSRFVPGLAVSSLIVTSNTTLTSGQYLLSLTKPSQLHKFALQKLMNQSQPKNPLHGITLKSILEYLVAEYGWERLGERINIQCFTCDPSINSSLKFLRKTDWAREKVERLYLYSISYDQRHGKNKADAEERQSETDADADESPSETGSVWDRARKK